MIAALIEVYVARRTDSERFIDTFQRLGIDPFKARAYEGRDRRRAAKPIARESDPEKSKEKEKEVVNA